MLTVCYMLNLSTICLRILSCVASSSLTWTFALWAPRYLDFQVCVTAQFSSKCITCLCLTNASSSLCCEDVYNCIWFLENLASTFVVGRHIVTFGFCVGRPAMYDRHDCFTIKAPYWDFWSWRSTTMDPHHTQAVPCTDSYQVCSAWTCSAGGESYSLLSLLHNGIMLFLAMQDKAVWEVHV